MEEVIRAPICEQIRDGEGEFAIIQSFRVDQSLSLVQAILELRDVLGEDTISTDDEDLHRHGYSEWSSINIDQLPVAVAYPKSTEECATIAKVCYKYKIPMSTFRKMHIRMSVDSAQSHILGDRAWKPTSRLHSVA